LFKIDLNLILKINCSDDADPDDGYGEGL